MATTLTYTISPYVPFTKILSSSINQDKTDIQNRLNWSGGTDTTTGLSGDNIQSNTILETKASLVLQGITFTATSGWGASGNNTTIQYTSGGTAGSEVVSVSGQAVTIQVQSGVSTVTQVVAAVVGNYQASLLAVASGSSSSTITTSSVTNLAGGVTSGGLVRSTKLVLDSANYVLINDSNGKVSSEPFLSINRGGLGSRVALTNPGDVVQVNSGGTAYTTGVSPIPPAMRIIAFERFI